MCDKIDRRKTGHALGLFRKGNEPADMAMDVEVAQCRCGIRFFARVVGGSWVDAELVIDAAAA